MQNKIIVKFSLCLAFYITLIQKSSAQKSEAIDCSNDELVTSIFNDPIDLTMRGIIKTYENVTINEILSTANNEFQLNYIDARLENGSSINGTKNLILFTTEHFENYAKEQTAIRISLKINLGCGMGKERVVIFFQPLKEDNYFSPTFSKTNYELIVPTPIFAGFDLTAFLEITAKDDDLTHNQISFTSNDSSKYYIRVGTKNITTADKKTYFANLTLERILLELPQPFKFEIVATDNGIPPKNSTASITIRSDPQRSLPPKPQFTQTLYKGFIKPDFSMAPIQLQLLKGTYTPEVEFSLNAGGIQGFNLVDYKNSSIDIIWDAKTINRSDILRRGTWELDVKAAHTNLAEVGSSTVLVEMADVKNNFKFMSSYYEGSIDELGELHINSIIFNPDTYQPDMEFSLQDFHILFHLSINNFSIQLQLNNNFSWHDIDDIGYLKLSLQASWENLSSMTHIIIKLPQIKNETLKQMLEFEKPLYLGHLNATYGLELETISLQTTIRNASEIVYTLSGNDSDKFYMRQHENRIDIEAIFNLLPQTEVKLKQFYLLIVQANYKDYHTYASVLINTFEELKKKVFLARFVKGTLLLSNSTNNQKLVMESIPLANDFKNATNNLKFRLRGDHSLHFDVKENLASNYIDIVLKTALPDHIFATKHLLNMTLQATLTGSHNFTDSLLVFIELPMKECPTNITTPSDPPQFSNSNYVFTIYTNQTGILGIVNAFSKGNTDSLHYTLGVENELLAQRLSINPFTGELTLYGTIAEGNYLFNITAENVETRARAVVKALLRVQQKEDCKLFEGVAVEKTLMILHVDEEKPNYGLLNLKFNENCTFHIEDMWPNDKEYVHVNYIFNMLDAISIDREDEIFENMTESQVVVKLRLKCELEDKQQNLTIEIPIPEERGPSQISLIEDIPYAPDIMWLYLIIDDINDNAPEFKISEGPLYLGYPSGNAPLHVYPEYLTQIEASDRDLGYNAAIVFAMKNNSYFDIEPSTGKIYPKQKALSKDEQTELIIAAIDQYGEGLISKTVVVVKGLSSDFYSLITLKENTARNKQQMEINLSEETGYSVNILKMSYVPQEIRQRSSATSNFSCKAWIYAYDKHQLVTHKDMQEQILVKHSEANIMNIESFDEATSPMPLHDSTNVGYLTVTIVLSLISCSALIFIVWRFCCKSSQPPKCDTKTSSLAAAAIHNGNRCKQQFHVECSHGFDNARDCTECKNNDDNNHVKFSDLVENGMVASESQSKCN